MRRALPALLWLVPILAVTAQEDTTHTPPTQLPAELSRESHDLPSGRIYGNGGYPYPSGFVFVPLPYGSLPQSHSLPQGNSCFDPYTKTTRANNEVWYIPCTRFTCSNGFIWQHSCPFPSNYGNPACAIDFNQEAPFPACCPVVNCSQTPGSSERPVNNSEPESSTPLTPTTEAAFLAEELSTRRSRPSPFDFQRFIYQLSIALERLAVMIRQVVIP